MSYPPQLRCHVPQKSGFIAFLLAFLFGPLGMLYSTVAGSLIMMFFYVAGGVVAGVFALLPLWIAGMIWAVVAVNAYNRRVQMAFFLAQGAAPPPVAIPRQQSEVYKALRGMGEGVAALKGMTRRQP